MLFGVFLTLGVAMLSVALRSFQNSYSKKRARSVLLSRHFWRSFL